MNFKLKLFGLSFLLLCGFLLPTFAQTSKISNEEFIQIKNAAYKKTSADSYRKKYKSQHFHHIKDKTPYFQKNGVIAFAENGSHSIVEEINQEGITRIETIEINDRIYSKENNGGWKDVTPPPQPRRSGGGLAVSGELKNDKKTQQKYLGKQNVNGQTVDVYEQKTTRNYEKGIGSNINEEKIWLDENGRYLKTETKSRFGDNHIFQMTVEYEYDPTIKIIAPQIK